MKSKRVTLRAIAEQAGVSVMTVSYALRDHTRIAPATRQRIKALAAQMGYQPDPALSALAAYRHSRHREKINRMLGLVTFGNDKDSWKSGGSRGYMVEVFAGIEERASELGYSIDILWADDPNLKIKQLDRILASRGIAGLLLSIGVNRDIPLPFTLARYACVGVSRSWEWSGIDFVATNYFMHSAMAWQQCRDRGYRRIGFISDKENERKFQGRMLAAYLERQASVGELNAASESVFLYNGKNNAEFGPWLERFKPEAIISFMDWIKPDMKDFGYRIPENLGWVNPILVVP
jgi:DNA-binding LacI/PurR family transcriptional regulator